MDDKETKVLETSAALYCALPSYLINKDSKQDIAHFVIDLIDALDDVEYARTGEPFFNMLRGDVSGQRKTAILQLEKECGLTERESHILRYLANERNPTYIASALGISKSTAKAHKYSIFKKLGIHTSEELKQLLDGAVVSPTPKSSLQR